MNSIDRDFIGQLSKGYTESHRDKKARPDKDEVLIDNGWEIIVPKGSDIVIRTAVKDFVRYLKVCMGVDVGIRYVKVMEKERFRKEQVIILRRKEEILHPTWRTQNDRNNLQSEGAFEIVTDDSCVVVRGKGSSGVMYGLYHLEKVFDFRGAPILKRGEIRREPVFRERITNTVFSKIWEDPGDKDAYRDGYLSRISQFGYNGIFLYSNLFEYSVSKILPELNGSDAIGKIKRLNQLTSRCGKYGLGIYLVLSAPKIPGNHKVFIKHPGVKGATQWDRESNCLCSSHPKILNYYNEAISNIFLKVPALKGVIFIIGGEGLHHCFTRPKPRTYKGTCCPRCGRLSPDRVVSGLMNSVARAVKSVRPDATIIAWPYSAHIWSEDKEQLGFIKRLSKDVTLMDVFEKDEIRRFGNVSQNIFDYSISFIGPSERFKRQYELTRSCGISMWAKTESAISIEFFNVPSIPVMYRWYERFRRLGKFELAGIMGAWRNYGWTGSITEEIADWYSWGPEPPINELLKNIAKRDFGKRTGTPALKAWRYFSDAMEEFPFSAGVTGAPYFRGPFWLGPAHPLIFNPQERSHILERFYKVDPAILEMQIDEKEAKRLFSQSLYLTDLRWTQPFGVGEVIRRLERFAKEWKKGLDLWEKVISIAEPAKRARAEEEKGVSEMIWRTVITGINVARFYKGRDEYFSLPSSMKRTGSILVELLSIAKEELQNAEQALELVKRDYRLGYGYTYGMAWTPDLIEKKIEHTRNVIEKEIPQFAYYYGTHLFEDKPDEFED
ncbi:MAG: hypothetical protein HYY56_02730 [Candidatus Omnitrophica bacterium]|nr:hypothetical protein [Candidatus Omnitrophota bacterium]